MLRLPGILSCQPLIGAGLFVTSYLLSPPICSANRPLRGGCCLLILFCLLTSYE